MLRKSVAGAVFAVVALWPGAAFAHSCVNVSRPPCDTSGAPLASFPDGPGTFFNLYAESGRWVCFTITSGSAAPGGTVEVGPTWGMDQPATGSLLANSRHCTDPSPADKKTFNGDPAGWHGIQTGCTP